MNTVSRGRLNLSIVEPAQSLSPNDLAIIVGKWLEALRTQRKPVLKTTIDGYEDKIAPFVAWYNSESVSLPTTTSHLGFPKSRFLDKSAPRPRWKRSLN